MTPDQMIPDPMKVGMELIADLLIEARAGRDALAAEVERLIQQAIERADERERYRAAWLSARRGRTNWRESWAGTDKARILADNARLAQETARTLRARLTEVDTLMAERDALAAQVQRVREVLQAGHTAAYDLRADILAALDGEAQ